VAGSSPIHVLDPEQDVDQPRHRMADIQRLDYVIDTEDLLALPVGDRMYPRLSTCRSEKGPSLRFLFNGTRRGMGVLYCLDGDIIARRGFNALEHASAMLHTGGWLALETQIHHSPTGETLLNRFVPEDFKGDAGCWWFLDRATLLAMLKLTGFHAIAIVSEWRNDDVIGPDMRRLCLVARKA